MSAKDAKKDLRASQQSGDQDFNEFTEMLRCYICMDKLKNACMCPHCTQTSCYQCIKYWVTSHKAECPHCRAKLVENDLIKVPLVQELSDFILAKKSQLPSGKGHSKIELCEHHPKEQLSVYCETCGVCVCTNCALWGQHRQDQGHSIKPLDDLYKKQKQQLKDDLAKLKEYMKDIVPLMETIEMTMEGVKLQKSKLKHDIDVATGNMHAKLEEQMKIKLQKLLECRKRLKKQAIEISTVCTDLESRMSGSKSAFINQRDELGSRLEAVLREMEKKVNSSTVTLPDIEPYVNEVVPPYETSQFEIKNYTALREKEEEVYSGPLNFCGLSWRLKVYPNGTGQFAGKYLGVFIELCAGYSQSELYHYCVEMVHGAGTLKQPGNSFITSRNFKREYSSDYAVGESWGYKKFYDLSKLASEGFLVQDTLLLKFSVRHPNYQQKCRDYGMYVNDLKHKIMSLKHQNTQLQQKCEGIYVANKDIDDPVSTPSPNSQPAQTPVSSPPDTSQSKDTSSSTGIGNESVQMAPERPHNPSSLRSSQGSTPALSQPASYGTRERLHRMEGDARRGAYPLTPHTVLAQPVNKQQRMHYQNSQALGRSMEHHMMYPPDMPFMPHPRRTENMDGRRQSYERMIYEQSQQQHSPHKMMHGGQGSLSQMDFAQYSVHQSLEPLDGVPFSNMHPSPRHSYIPMGGSFHEGSQTEDIGFSNEESSVAPGGSNSQVSHSQLSQEPIELLQQTSEILSLNTLTDDTLMSQKMQTVGLTGLDMSQQEEEYLHYHQQHLRHPQKRNKHPPSSNKLGGKSRMSLSDLSALPNNSQSLTETAFLSQSVQALQEQQQQQATLPRQNKPGRSKSLHRSHEHLNRLRPNESSQGNNFYGQPGLISSVTARLAAPTSSLTQGNKRQQGNQQRHHTSSQSIHHQKQKQQKQQISSTAGGSSGGSSSLQAQPVSHTQPEPSDSKVNHRRGSSTDTTNSDRSSASPEGSSTSLTQTSEPRLTRSGRRSYTNLKKSRPIQINVTEDKTPPPMPTATQREENAQRLTAGGKTSSNTSLNDIL